MPGKPGHSGRHPKVPVQSPSGGTSGTPAEHSTESDSSPPKKRGRPPKQASDCEYGNKTDVQVTQHKTTEQSPPVNQRKLS